jgi:hypothetical protein
VLETSLCSSIRSFVSREIKVKNESFDETNSGGKKLDEKPGVENGTTLYLFPIVDGVNELSSPGY